MSMHMLFANNATSRLFVAIDALTTSIRVQAGDGAKFPMPAGDGSNFFTLTLEDRRNGTLEICHCTARSSDFLTVERGKEGTTPRAFALGATVSNRLTAETMTLLMNSGATGPQGEKGDTGPAGPIGPQGIPGDTGPQGAQGETGAQGEQGEQGLTGDQGPQGETGPSGIDGTPGETGPAGPKGEPGTAGADSTVPGPEGPQGPQGEKGDTGATGAASTVPGPQGPEGDPGPIGARGPIGPAGPAGVNGSQVMFIGDNPPPAPINGMTWWESDTGNSYVYYNDPNTTQWVQTNAGVIGPTGAQGPVGPAGETGPTGATGATGAAGPAGPKGDTGEQGPQGIPGETGTQATYIGELPPSSPIAGQFWYENDTGNTFIWYNDGDSGQWVQINIQPPSVPSVNPYATADTRNRIVNGAMQISQELGFDVGGAFTNNSYVADQWQLSVNGTTALPRASCNTAEPDGNYIRVNSFTTVDAAVAAGDLVYYYSRLEGIRIRDFAWGTAQAKPAVFRFSARVTTVPSLVIGASIRTSTGSHHFVRNVTLTNVWQDFVIPIPGPTVGVWAVDNAIGALINFGVMCGSTYLAPAENVWGTGSCIAAAGVDNFAAVANTYVDIKNVGLYLDPDNTGVAPRWQMPDEAEELQACQRYYYKTSGPSGPAGPVGYRYATAGMTFTDAGILPFPTTMRIIPAGAIEVAPTYSNCSAGSLYSDQNASIFRVTVTAAGSYRTLSGQFSFSARM